MKRIRFIVATMLMILTGTSALAQGGAPVYTLDASTNGTTLTIGSDGAFYLGSQVTYGNSDLSVVLAGNCTAPYKLCLEFESFNVKPTDTLYIYDGNSTSAPRLYSANNNNTPLQGLKVFCSNLNTSNVMTIRYVTHSDTAGGFYFKVLCRFPCETVVPHIDDMYFKLRNGVVYDTGYARMVSIYDTNYIVTTTDSITFDSLRVIDTLQFRGIHLCLGDEVIINGHGEYSHEYGLYNPSDVTTMFRWNLGNGDTVFQPGQRQVAVFYHSIDCYNVSLSLVDEQGCTSSVYETVIVRLSQNPIKTIFDLASICNSDSLYVNVGYEGENSSITLQKIVREETRSKTYSVRTFVPDGPYCETTCFTAPVEFTDFPTGRQVTSKEDICSICINYEHEFMGDYKMSIICPTGNSAVLKYKNNPTNPTQYPLGIDTMHSWYAGGGGDFTGYPYGGNAHHNGWDGSGSSAIICDSLHNPYGVGLDYCFSRNVNYTLVNGMPASTLNTDCDHYIACITPSTINDDPVVYMFPPVMAPFVQAGQSPGDTCRFSTRHPSDHERKEDYYTPVSTFQELVGCPLNGVWEIEVCDDWGSDNGWIFNWSLDICGVSNGAGCEYQVGLDSLKWLPDTANADFNLGHYRGLVINKHNATTAYISSPDTAGTFNVLVRLYDEFGCEWDTNTRITTIWTPEPELGDDILLCDVESTVLDASDRHSKDRVNNNYSFMWEPFGQTTDTIHTAPSMGSSTLYTVEVENFMHDKSCITRDSVRVNINRQPTPNFDPGIYPLEGCEPFTIHFNNTSVGGDKYVWVFGDGDTSFAQSPDHTYATGQYSFKYFVSTNAGCNDSLVYEDLITVYSSPVAKFSWDPVNPTVLHPEVQFINMTVPQSDKNMYYWEIQYDRDNNISYHTMTDVNPSFEWYTDGEDISGTYIARLIAKTNNMGPSGMVIECRDTIENTILLVNDFLQFPNAITPNGDGYNDKFVIKNLVDGMGYPNNSLAIYDRWGKRVYYKENISSEDDFWDPAADNIPAGTYFWRFVGKGYLGDIQRNGVVEVLK